MKALMVQGTTSDAGKSTLVAALCRIFAAENSKVAPFKPQNMALNSAVTDDGGEIGRAQALQAVAAKVPARIDFNPILLKPNSDTGAQVIVHGRAISNMEASTYHDYKQVAFDAVMTSYQRLSEDFDVLVVEGAGSPAEINLRAGDIANMGFAEAVDCPVIIIADIDKGGVFAHLVGTLALLSESEQQRVKGFVINRFRGDIALLQSGLDWLEEYTNKPVLGVLPYLHELALDAEDAISVANKVENPKINIGVLVLPHISNHTDFDVLRINPSINLQYISVFEDMPQCDLFVLPGSKNVIGDLQQIVKLGWDVKLKQHLRYGGKLLGICGGFQMLGTSIFDPTGIESSVTGSPALGLADFETTLTETKQLKKVKATLLFSEPHAVVNGYEIHCGVSQGPSLQEPAIHLQTSVNSKVEDGFISQDKQIIGTYVHGLFDSPESCTAIFEWVKPNQNIDSLDINNHREQQIEKLAAVCREHLNIEQIKRIMEQHYE
jgi:adenosylcobyric acid synthase